jgi:DNA-binding response OmpR family regulator
MSKKILVIDDDEDVLEIVAFILEEKGHDIVKSLDGNILSQIDIVRPDLIILDNTIGAISGSDLCRGLKSTDSHKYIPVILCSAADELRNISKDCGADCYLPKPFNLDELDTAVSKMI